MGCGASHRVRTLEDLSTPIYPVLDRTTVPTEADVEGRLQAVWTAWDAVPEARRACLPPMPDEKTLSIDALAKWSTIASYRFEPDKKHHASIRALGMAYIHYVTDRADQLAAAGDWEGVKRVIRREGNAKWTHGVWWKMLMKYMDNPDELMDVCVKYPTCTEEALMWGARYNRITLLRWLMEWGKRAATIGSAEHVYRDAIIHAPSTEAARILLHGVTRPEVDGRLMPDDRISAIATRSDAAWLLRKHQQTQRGWVGCDAWARNLGLVNDRASKEHVDMLMKLFGRPFLSRDARKLCMTLMRTAWIDVVFDDLQKHKCLLRDDLRQLFVFAHDNGHEAFANRLRALVGDGRSVDPTTTPAVEAEDDDATADTMNVEQVRVVEPDAIAVV